MAVVRREVRFIFPRYQPGRLRRTIGHALAGRGGEAQESSPCVGESGEEVLTGCRGGTHGAIGHARRYRESGDGVERALERIHGDSEGGAWTHDAARRALRPNQPRAQLCQAPATLLRKQVIRVGKSRTQISCLEMLTRFGPTLMARTREAGVSEKNVESATAPENIWPDVGLELYRSFG
ncbi:MAG TPA: hypothetical protein VMT20_00365 [Terriglobia bacterium]|nr:hypothetical protein [Terriglobia bacterium]